jgi:hypothetical protein
LLDALLPFTEARSLGVILEPDDWGKVDIFIDDGMVITPDLLSNRYRSVQA